MKQEILPPLPAVIETGADPAIDPDDLPGELAFTPVEQRAKRWTGITAQKQRIFIAHLAASGAVSMAAKVAGHSTSAFYQLRKRDDAGSFAAAWDKAVEAGARRVADLLMEYAIYGVPETISKRGQVILERRRPNIRAMQHIAASRFPENFSGIDPVDGRPASAIPHSIRRLREKWQAEWEAERHAEMREHNARANRQETDLDDRLRIIRTGFQRKISHDPVKRAAWDLLTGPGTDWAAARKEDAYTNPHKHEWHMHHPDMIVPIAAGAGNIDWQAQEGGDLSSPNPPPADHVPWTEGGREDEIWFERYEDHMIEGEAGESDLANGRIARGDMRAAANRLRERAEAPLPSDFERVVIGKLTRNQVEQYLEKFLKVVGGIPAKDINDKVIKFLKETDQRANDLRSNPLMLGLMSWLFLNKDDIPANRPEIYRECAILMFERWDQKRGIIAESTDEIDRMEIFSELASEIYTNPAKHPSRLRAIGSELRPTLCLHSASMEKAD